MIQGTPRKYVLMWTKPIPGAKPKGLQNLLGMVNFCTTPADFFGLADRTTFPTSIADCITRAMTGMGSLAFNTPRAIFVATLADDDFYGSGYLLVTKREARTVGGQDIPAIAVAILPSDKLS